MYSSAGYTSSNWISFHFNSTKRNKECLTDFEKEFTSSSKTDWVNNNF